LKGGRNGSPWPRRGDPPPPWDHHIHRGGPLQPFPFFFPVARIFRIDGHELWIRTQPPLPLPRCCQSVTLCYRVNFLSNETQQQVLRAMSRAKKPATSVLLPSVGSEREAPVPLRHPAGRLARLPGLSEQFPTVVPPLSAPSDRPSMQLSSQCAPPTLSPSLLPSCLSPQRESERERERVCVCACACAWVFIVYTHTPSLRVSPLWLSSSSLYQIRRKVRPAVPSSWKPTGTVSRPLSGSFALISSRKRGRQKKREIKQAHWRQLPPHGDHDSEERLSWEILLLLCVLFSQSL